MPMRHYHTMLWCHRFFSNSAELRKPLHPVITLRRQASTGNNSRFLAELLDHLVASNLRIISPWGCSSLLDFFNQLLTRRVQYLYGYEPRFAKQYYFPAAPASSPLRLCVPCTESPSSRQWQLRSFIFPLLLKYLG
ncbi:hypothetical protein RRG08_019218 [Elysia crispata]|uniref:Uncharacterized protein n=1 Tax=Elysia crispata TaxID=231223 RepID=A0AAE1ATR3_9GAST|nr:hypothetical protein RRG08_019218 [Elysia crispata]